MHLYLKTKIIDKSFPNLNLLAKNNLFASQKTPFLWTQKTTLSNFINWSFVALVCLCDRL